ncbi:MAG: hypothetical protein ABI560_18905, partial [Myxococcales bacterium]
MASGGNSASGGATGGSSSSSGGSSTGGQATSSGGSGDGTGGLATPGSGGTASGGIPGTGGSGNGGSGTAGSGSGGNGTGGSGLGGQSGDRWGGLKNPPVKSAGCGKPAGITTALKTIMSGGRSREYWIDLPPNYDMDKPSLVVFIYHWSGGTAASMKSNKYYNIQPLA